MRIDFFQCPDWGVGLTTLFVQEMYEHPVTGYETLPSATGTMNCIGITSRLYNVTGLAAPGQISITMTTIGRLYLAEVAFYADVNGLNREDDADQETPSYYSRVTSATELQTASHHTTKHSLTTAPSSSNPLKSTTRASSSLNLHSSQEPDTNNNSNLLPLQNTAPFSYSNGGGTSDLTNQSHSYTSKQSIRSVHFYSTNVCLPFT